MQTAHATMQGNSKKEKSFLKLLSKYFFFPREFIQVSLIGDMRNPKLIFIWRWTRAYPNFVKPFKRKLGDSQPGQVESKQPWAVLTSHNLSPGLARMSVPKPGIVGSWQEL